MSTDLVHWERLPPALIPDTEYDCDGVFSGSATVLHDGTPSIFFTGMPSSFPASHKANCPFRILQMLDSSILLRARSERAPAEDSEVFAP